MPASFNRSSAARKSATPVPDTAMAAAFLRALVRWAARHTDAPATIVIPTGHVDGAELARVLHALFGGQS
jgi:hypothetical protein